MEKKGFSFEVSDKLKMVLASIVAVSAFAVVSQGMGHQIEKTENFKHSVVSSQMIQKIADYSSQKEVKKEFNVVDAHGGSVKIEVIKDLRNGDSPLDTLNKMFGDGAEARATTVDKDGVKTTERMYLAQSERYQVQMVDGHIKAESLKESLTRLNPHSDHNNTLSVHKMNPQGSAIKYEVVAVIKANKVWNPDNGKVENVLQVSVSDHANGTDIDTVVNHLKNPDITSGVQYTSPFKIIAEHSSGINLKEKEPLVPGQYSDPAPDYSTIYAAGR